MKERARETEKETKVLNASPIVTPACWLLLHIDPSLMEQTCLFHLMYSIIDPHERINQLIRLDPVKVSESGILVDDDVHLKPGRRRQRDAVGLRQIIGTAVKPALTFELSWVRILTISYEFPSSAFR